jgi:Polysaccharide biosynthesis C-terminal domain
MCGQEGGRRSPAFPKRTAGPPEFELGDAGLIPTASNIAFNFVLIPSFGAQGAACGSVLALKANLAAHVVSYRRSYGF